MPSPNIGSFLFLHVTLHTYITLHSCVKGGPSAAILVWYCHLRSPFSPAWDVSRLSSGSLGEPNFILQPHLHSFPIPFFLRVSHSLCYPVHVSSCFAFSYPSRSLALIYLPSFVDTGNPLPFQVPKARQASCPRKDLVLNISFFINLQVRTVGLSQWPSVYLSFLDQPLSAAHPVVPC
jgi:hypothetical protein